jgi:NitT/TauT family transport system substrate-binding protein
MRLSRRAVLATAGTAVTAGCTGSIPGGGNGDESGATPSIEDATLLLNWKPNGLHAPYYVAKARGYYEQAGVPISKIEPGQGSGFSAKQAGLGNASFVVTSSDQVLRARSRGLSPLSVGVLMQDSPVVLFSTRESLGTELTRVGQLEGKTVGTGPGMVRLLTKLLLERTGVLSAVELVDTGYDTVQQLLSGKIDAAGGVFGDAIVASGRGPEVDRIKVAATIPSYGHVVATEGRFARRHPVAVKRFLRATAHGAAWAHRHPEAAIGILIDAEASLAETRDQQRDTWAVMASEYLLSGAVRERGWGWSRAEPWETTTSTLEGGDLLNGAVDPEAAWTNEYLDTDAEYIGSYASIVDA